MEPNNQQAQGLYRLCYRLTNVIYPGWQYRAVELVRIDERTGNNMCLPEIASTLKLSQQEDMSHDDSQL
jgi:hypothetical protein